MPKHHPVINCVELVANDREEVSCRPLAIDSPNFNIKTANVVNRSDRFECGALDNYGYVTVYIIPTEIVKKTEAVLENKCSVHVLGACCVLVSVATFVLTRYWFMNRVYKIPGF